MCWVLSDMPQYFLEDRALIFLALKRKHICFFWEAKKHAEMLDLKILTPELGTAKIPVGEFVFSAMFLLVWRWVQGKRLCLWRKLADSTDGIKMVLIHKLAKPLCSGTFLACTWLVFGSVPKYYGGKHKVACVLLFQGRMMAKGTHCIFWCHPPQKCEGFASSPSPHVAGGRTWLDNCTMSGSNSCQDR